ncbi:unnamed protein product [Staurois parvus]|uniref:Uncharacterized protein n=1 Tax=Staurois parvus TaxID=386267 RepID=A0ABN9B167_9NEOB|nr:unnamed protein product [Staurois parvus]
MSAGELQDVKHFLENCIKMTGIVPIIVLTFKTAGDYMETEKKFRLMGAETVIAIENYTRESHKKTLRKNRRHPDGDRQRLEERQIPPGTAKRPEKRADRKEENFYVQLHQ